jgi:cobalt-zinc-cadmium efflux system protein
MSDHSHAGCSHCHTADSQTLDAAAKRKQLSIALLLIGSFAAVEFIVGHLSHSLVLVADSGHMVSDGLSLGLALLAAWGAQRARQRSAIGAATTQAWETWAALVNGLSLTVIAGWVAWEAIDHLQAPPPEIASLPMLITASVGLAINSANIAVLHRGSQHDLNLRGALLHVAADALSSIGGIVAAIAVAAFHWIWADGAISLFVAGLISLSAVPLVVQSLRQLTQPAQMPLP